MNPAVKRFWKNISNRDKLCYALVVAFGAFLLLLMLFFTFGYQLGEIEARPFIKQQGEEESTVRILLIDEPNPVVRGIEMGVAVGMIVLGAERLKTYKRRKLQGYDS